MVVTLNNLIGILGGTPVIMGMQRLRTPPVNTIVGAISFMGEEEFYTLLLPLIIWIFEARMGHLLTLLMATAFYCTGTYTGNCWHYIFCCKL